MLGPLLPPLLLVVVSRLWLPLWAAAVVLTGVPALLNETQPCAVESSKPYCATTWALPGWLHRRSKNVRQTETCADRNILFPPRSTPPRIAVNPFAVALTQISLRSVGLVKRRTCRRRSRPVRASLRRWPRIIPFKAYIEIMPQRAYCDGMKY